MTSATQFVDRNTGSAGAAGAFGAPGRVPGRAGEAEETGALPGRDGLSVPAQRGSQPPPAGIVRLPGQEGPAEPGPRRPLISGGAFTLAVAIGLSLDRSGRAEELEPVTPSSAGDAAPAEEGGSDAVGDEGLSEEEKKAVEELRARDAEVRRHEAAHAAAGGQYAGSPTFTYQTGPDGRQYAVGGEVSIDTAPVKGDPEATIRKSQQIKAAASAPADPSSQDRRVAAQADALAQQARAELAAEKREEGQAAAAEGPGAAAAGPAGIVGAAGVEQPPPTDGFAQGAFSAAAASYRGPAQSSRLVSIAV